MCIKRKGRFSIYSLYVFFVLTEFAKNFGVKAATKTSVLLTWEVPETYKPQVPFKVTLSLTHTYETNTTV